MDSARDLIDCREIFPQIQHLCALLLAEEELKTLRALFGGSGWKAIDHHLKQRDDGKA